MKSLSVISVLSWLSKSVACFVIFYSPRYRRWTSVFCHTPGRSSVSFGRYCRLGDILTLPDTFSRDVGISASTESLRKWMIHPTPFRYSRRRITTYYIEYQGFSRTTSSRLSSERTVIGLSQVRRIQSEPPRWRRLVYNQVHMNFVQPIKDERKISAIKNILR